MICKNCQQEMPEVGEFCPFCGAVKEETPVQTPAPEPKPGKKIWLPILIIAGGIVLLGLLTCAILYGLGMLSFENKEPAEETQAQVVGENGSLIYSEPYTADDATAMAGSEKIVATMGDKTLTNGELQLYYQNIIYTFYYEYYYYMSYMGLDLSLPLNEQVCGMSADQTWEEFFLEGALANWQSYTLVEILAEQDDFQVNEELRAILDGMTDELKVYAEAEGYDDMDAYIREGMGVNVRLEDYLHFNEVYYVTGEYLDAYAETIHPTADEIEAYYTENEPTFTENGVTRDLGLTSSVRHILVAVEGGTENEDGTVTYSEEDWNTALAEAERILEQWKNGAATEESFAELANSCTDDPGSATTGGLYEDVNVDASYVEPFENWAIDASRKPGDTAIVKTDFGYHIMYFVEGEDYWSYLVGEELVAEKIQEILLAAKEQYPIDINYENICLAQASFV